MARPRCCHLPTHHHPQKIQIAKAVQNLVFDEFMLHAQAGLIQNAAIFNDDGVVQRPAKGQPGILHGGHITHLAEGARRGKVTLKPAIAVLVVESLAPDGRILKIDLGIDLQPAMGFDHCPAAAMLDTAMKYCTSARTLSTVALYVSPEPVACGSWDGK